MKLSFYNLFNQKIDYSAQKSNEHLEFYQMFDALKQDLQNMLNTQPRIKNAKEYGLSNTILDYGLANLKNFNLQSAEDQEIFRITVQQCIEIHEPRLTDISIIFDKNENFSLPDLTINFKIYATFLFDNTTQPLVLQSSLHTVGGNIIINNIKDEQYEP